MTMNAQALLAAQNHAINVYPNEACGLVVAGSYVPCDNVHEDPLRFFKIASEVMVRYRGKVEMIVHSHPDGPAYPSTSDMQQQIITAVPWVIIATDGERASPPVIWGDQWPMAPILGRPFVHGVWDCMALIRDSFRLGKEGLLAQDVSHSWPFDAVPFADCPREDGWWDVEGVDLYTDNFPKWGFVKIPMSEAKAGDVFLGSVTGDKLSHGGVLVEDDLLMHHLPGRASRREPAGIWARSAKVWCRYVGEGSIYA